jgi:hypothetical protein
MVGCQGDQIWANFCPLGDFFLWAVFIYSSSPKIGLLLNFECYALIFSQIVLGYILGDFFTNTYGHPAGFTI